LLHDNLVSTVKFSPDGRLVFTTDQALTTRVFDAATGRPVGPPTRYSAAIQPAPTFCPDGKSTLTVCYDQTAWVREIAPPGLPLSPLKDAGPVGTVEFSGDGRRFLTISAWNPAGRDGMARENTKAVRTWDAETGRPLAPPVMHDEQVGQATFSPDGRRVASLTEHELRIWDAETGRPVGPPTRADDSFRSLAFSPDSRRVVVASRPDAVTLLAVEGGPPLWKWLLPQTAPPGRFLIQVRFWADGSKLVVDSNDGSIVLLDAASGKVEGQAREPLSTGLQLSPDGRRAFFGSRAGKGTLLDTQSVGASAVVFHQGSPLVVPRGFSPDGSRILTSSQEPSLSIWDAATARLLLPPLPTGGPLNMAAYSADGRRILTSTFGGKVRLWDALTGQPLSPLLQDSRFDHKVVFSPDGRRVLSIGGNSEGQPEAWLWNLLPDGRPIDELTRMVTLMTGRRIDPRFGLMPADPESIRDAWEATRQALLHGDDPTRSLAGNP
jgi:WD40 repeat protein